METIQLEMMEDHHFIGAHQANIAIKRNIYNEVDPSTSCNGGRVSLAATNKPLVSSWLPTLHSTLSSLLRSTGSYPAQIQDSHLAFVREGVIPHLKQPPTAVDRLHYILTHNHSPYEASVAFAPEKLPKVRFTVQPLVDLSPVDDPLGQKGLREKMEGLAAACGADCTWLDAFVDCIFLTPEEEAGLVKKEHNGDSTSELPRQICYAGFDLESDEDENGKASIGMKAYLFPQLKALATGRDLVGITESVLARLADGDKGMLAAWELLKTFFSSHGEDNINIYFLAIDCLATQSESNKAQPRFKIYAHTHANSLALAREVLTLGGRLPPSSAEFLPTVWPFLMDMEDVPRAQMESLEKPLNEPDSKYCGLCFAFELVPGKAVPQVKMYVPMWQYARDEAGTVERYQRILQTQGIMGDYKFVAGVQDAL
ncbi:hypothetical protein N0V82_008346 [Gnomoniopsis sp. IMI 355080]|nr:hypothetical protein N0V82_008346 [Gnomoniopsis sp. IMI 355080]